LEIVKDNRPTINTECWSCKSILKINKEDITVDYKKGYAIYNYYCPLCRSLNGITALQYAELNKYI